MPELTRRRLKERFESWGIFFGDVQVGAISEINGTAGKMIWQWSCGFYPGCATWQQSAGKEDSFDKARAAFQRDWERLQPKITPEMLAAWRKDRAFTAWKYAMRAAGCRLPTQSTTGRSHCFCGVELTIASVPEHVYDRHMGTNDSDDN